MKDGDLHSAQAGNTHVKLVLGLMWVFPQVLCQDMPPFWCLIFLGGLLPPSQGFLNLLKPAQPSGGGQPGSSGLLGTGILGGKGLGAGLVGEGLGTGILGGEGLASGILGGEGLASGILGGEGLATGLLGGEGLGNGLLNNGLLGNGLLGNNSLLGETGLLGTGLLGKGGLLGNGSLLGLDGVLGAAGGLLGGGGPQKMTRYAWLKVLNLENARVSWKVLRGTELVLNLYSKLVLRFPGIFQFLSGSSVEANITSHIALTQDSPGDLKLVVKNCSNLLGGFSVSLRKGLLTNVVSSLVNKSLKSLVPALLCPIVNLWVSIININLQFLSRVISFGLLGKIYSALSKLPVTSGHYVELDLQNSPFPSTFIDWLLQTAGVNPRINP
ncbi:BPI fold-containing family B member 4-like [Passer domesticus]|uniref:BPI fold-containing family B member 4-like n=1 Tax=Passer domesticus TaxID=48849 RepID=UPI0030FEE64F